MDVKLTTVLHLHKGSVPYIIIDDPHFATWIIAYLYPGNTGQ